MAFKKLKVMKATKKQLKKEEGTPNKKKKEARLKLEHGGPAAAMVKPMKAMKKKKGDKKKSVIATGRFRRYVVFAGTKRRTSGGITKEGIERNKRGRYVSKKASAAGHRRYKNISAWNQAFSDARRQLNCQGFVPIGGKNLLGKALYIRMRKLIDTATPEGRVKAEQKKENQDKAADKAEDTAADVVAN